MRISYRQGLISAKADFLQFGQTDSRYIDLIVSPHPVIAAFADGDRDLLIGEYRTVTNAWGPFTGPATQYLYWEIDPLGKLSHGATSVIPVIAASAPIALVGQMWWDTTANVYKVYDGTQWIQKLRVFAGTLQSGGIITPSQFLSQVGLNTVADAGFVLTDSYGNVYKDNKGNFLTTESPLSSADTGSLVRLDGAEIIVQANENIPKFSLVYLIGGRAALASGEPPDNITKAPVGVVTTDAYQNDAVNVIPAGRTISFDQWAWATSDLGQPLYCGPTGQITTTKPFAQKNMRVGIVVSAQTILLNLDWETEPAAAIGNGILGVNAQAPLQILSAGQYPVVMMPRATTTVDGFMNQADFARIPALESALTNKADLVHTHAIADVIGLQAALDGRALVLHTHAISDVNGLSDALAGKANTVHTHVVADITDIQPIFASFTTAIASKIPKVMVGTGNFPLILTGGVLGDSTFAPSSFALAQHTHVIADVTGLQSALDGKANLVHTHVIADVIGLQAALDSKAALVHAHAIADVTGLSDALNGKANLVHTHVIADVIGLQAILDGKAALVHEHAIADVTGLQAALDLKSDVGHTHIISDITGLQLVLDSKADLNHVHVSKDITDLFSNVYGFVGNMFTTNNSALWFTNDLTNSKIILNVGSGFGGATWPLVSPENASIESNSDPANYGALTVRSTPGTSVTLVVGGTSTGTSGPDATLGITAHGEIKINGDGGVNGQIMTSAGPGAPASWEFASLTPHMLFNTLQSVLVQGPGINLIPSAYTSTITVESGAPSNTDIFNALRNILVAGTNVALIPSAYTSTITVDNSYSLSNIDLYNALQNVLVPGANVTLIPSAYQSTITVESDNVALKPAPLTIVQFDASTSTGNFGSCAEHNVAYRYVSTTAMSMTVQPDSFWTGSDTYNSNNFQPVNPGPMPIGGSTVFSQNGTGVLTFVAGPGVTINTPSTLSINKLNGKVVLIKVGPNTWDIEGNLN